MPWQTLGIAPTTDEREIRRAYARQLKTRQHEDNAEFFSRLRWAYESTIALCRQSVEDDFSLEIPAFGMEPSLLEEVFSTQELPPEPESSADEPQELESSLPEVISKEGKSPPPEPEACFAEKNCRLQDLFASLEDRFRSDCDPSQVCETWEEIRRHPELEMLVVREFFSEELAILLARHWPRSAALWPSARDFFGWHPPVFSEHTAFARALRDLFENAEMQEKLETVKVRKPPKKTWKDLLGFMPWLFFPKCLLYPGRLLLLILRVSKNIFAKDRPFVSPSISFLETIRKIGRDFHESTKLALHCMLGYLFFLLELVAVFNIGTLAQDYTGPRILSGPVILMLFLILHIMTITFLPHARAMKTFRSRLFRHSRIIACFFVIYFWIVGFSIPARIVFVILQGLVDWIGA
jgi:hypothetical protein